MLGRRGPLLETGPKVQGGQPCEKVDAWMIGQRTVLLLRLSRLS